MSREVDVLVLGAGPAGASAAIHAARHGLGVAVLDEAHEAGGQIYRAIPAQFTTRDPGRLGPDHADGVGLRAALDASGVERAFGRRVWCVRPGFEVSAVADGAPETWRARALVVAAGATERVVPFPGWTTPGVIGLGAATVLLKSQQMLPGERVVVAGSGPLLMAVAVGILDKGGRPAAVIDLHRPGAWLQALGAASARPGLLLRGLGWLARLRAAGVPICAGQAVCEARGGESVSEVVVRRVDSAWRPEGPSRTIPADALAIGHGLVPATEVTRLLRARHVFAADAGGWVPALDAFGRASVAGLYVAGDGAGIAGALAARFGGALSGIAVARDFGALPESDARAAARPIERSRRAALRFGGAMARLMAPRAGLVETTTADTVVCRCEDVTRAEIEAALAAGARDLNQLKSWTRCGMGPCQGRMCAEGAAMLVAHARGGRAAAGVWTPRPPLRPVGLDAMVGDYTYDDIPRPTPAPA